MLVAVTASAREAEDLSSNGTDFQAGLRVRGLPVALVFCMSYLPQYLGNWSSLNGTGILKWDQILFSTGGDPEAYGFEAQISGPGGSATFTSTIDDTVVGQWIAITAPIDQSSWTVNSGTWAGLLADVTSLNLSIENVTNIHTPTVQDPGDHDGIDNVFLGTTSVPEPTGLTLLGLGIAGAAASSCRFRRRVARRLNARRGGNLVERTAPKGDRES